MFGGADQTGSSWRRGIGSIATIASAPATRGARHRGHRPNILAAPSDARIASVIETMIAKRAGTRSPRNGGIQSRNQWKLIPLKPNEPSNAIARPAA